MRRKAQKKALPQRLSGLKVWQLVLLLVVVVGGGVVFVGAIAGWFNERRVVLGQEMYCDDGCDEYLVDIDVPEYDELLAQQKSFVLMVDQGGCKTADKLREYVKKYASEAGIKVYQMMFSDVKESFLNEYVKYYPSVVLVSRGKVVAWLKADADEDADEYNNYESFKAWMDKYLQ